VRVEILGVNRISEAQYNGNIGRVLNILPWIQDTTDQNVWINWRIAYRDVLILDAFNRPIATYNLTSHDLLNTSNRQALKQMMLDAAQSAAADSDSDGLLDIWETRWFGHTGATPTGDEDGDGIDNLSEFTFASNPTDPSSGHTARALVVRPAGKPALTMTFRRFAGNLTNLVVETSPDLRTWNATPSAIFRVGSLVNLYDGAGGAEARFQQTAASGAHPTGFIRVRAIHP